IRAMQVAEGILEAAKQRSGKALDVEAVDLGKLIDGAVAQASPVAKQRGVTVAAVPPSRPVEIRADGDLLARVLDNLIGNAIRFSPRGSQVEVAGWRASPRAARLGNKHTDLVLLDPAHKPGKKLEALRTRAKGAQVPVIELPSQMAAARLARTLAHLGV